jgi:hypothetical protein
MLEPATGVAFRIALLMFLNMRTTKRQTFSRLKTFDALSGVERFCSVFRANYRARPGAEWAPGSLTPSRSPDDDVPEVFALWLRHAHARRGKLPPVEGIGYDRDIVTG